MPDFVLSGIGLLIKKWIYGVRIIVIWLKTTARESVQIVLKEKGISRIFINSTLYLSFYLISVFRGLVELLTKMFPLRPYQGRV